MLGPFPFDAARARGALLYVVQKCATKLCGNRKLTFVADKSHLERYGSLISGEDYAAMVCGRVPSNTHIYAPFRIIKAAQPNKATSKST